MTECTNSITEIDRIIINLTCTLWNNRFFVHQLEMWKRKYFIQLYMFKSWHTNLCTKQFATWIIYQLYRSSSPSSYWLPPPAPAGPLFEPLSTVLGNLKHTIWSVKTCIVQSVCQNLLRKITSIEVHSICKIYYESKWATNVFYQELFCDVYVQRNYGKAGTCQT